MTVLSSFRPIHIPEEDDSRRKLSQELKWKIISFLAECTRAKMASCERETHQIEPRTYVLFIFELSINAKSLKKLLVIKEICSWLPPWLDGRKGRSQEHIFDH